MRAALAFLAIAALSSACIEPPVTAPEAAPVCERDSDCNAAEGEVCRDDICWGDPPEQAYAAVLIPPEDRPDLVRTELPALHIAADGSIGTVAFGEPVAIEGRVDLACGPDKDEADCEAATRALSVQVSVSRASQIPGLAPVTATALSQSEADGSGASFSVRLAPGPADSSYEVTLVPLTQAGLNSGAAGAGTAYVAPPARFSLDLVAADEDLRWSLGDPGQLRTVRGRLVDAVGEPVADMHVFATVGDVPLTVSARSSSLALTDSDGSFTLRIPRTAPQDERIDLVVEPPTPGDAPTLRILEVDVAAPDELDGDEDVVDIGSFAMPSYGEPQSFTVPVLGIDSGGARVAIAQADVFFETELETADERIKARFSTRTYTDGEGNATVRLIPGSEVENRRYLVRVLAPTGEHATIPFLFREVGATRGGVLESIELERRALVTGTVLTAQGEPAARATITASLSPQLRLELEPGLRSALELLPQPQVSADPNGSFSVWLDDHLVPDRPVAYDLSVRPVPESQQPQWTATEVGPPSEIDWSEEGTHRLGEIVLPEPSYAQATIVDPAGAPVPGAKLGIYALSDEVHSACALAIADTEEDADTACRIPPTYIGPFPSDEAGVVTVILPDP
ncbi:carboxypeptidase-like regulatory domain-containing protein [Haliangium ochraceum]|uniref:Uncharacterized protein n=1 Tax=Haliangium ochraceum (strain DSM 14365 / JCM 11303 / SMP-2) TaxID=502025 RepID=D0LYA1_HALO1|nr:carboxypeptidase-like regulatory domain-containing protein [Haliangium ochraceum]ACY16251.1 hypothetical protein Hoch_3751 [Haliangium ochraceum DSM 14365]